MNIFRHNLEFTSFALSLAINFFKDATIAEWLEVRPATVICTCGTRFDSRFLGFKFKLMVNMRISQRSRLASRLRPQHLIVSYS